MDACFLEGSIAFQKIHTQSHVRQKPDSTGRVTFNHGFPDLDRLGCFVCFQSSITGLDQFLRGAILDDRASSRRRGRIVLGVKWLKQGGQRDCREKDQWTHKDAYRGGFPTCDNVPHAEKSFDGGAKHSCVLAPAVATSMSHLICTTDSQSVGRFSLSLTRIVRLRLRRRQPISLVGPVE